MNRRAFLLGGAGVGATGLAGVATASPSLASPLGTIERFVRRHCPAGGLSDAEITEFAADYLGRSALTPARHRAVLFLIDNPWATRLVPAAIRDAQERQERHLVTRFLLSTDLFDEGRETGAARYWGAADPYGTGCANPVARFDPADDAPRRYNRFEPKDT